MYVLVKELVGVAVKVGVAVNVGVYVFVTVGVFEDMVSVAVKVGV